MANVEIQRVEFQSPQAVGVQFPINVVVENHETLGRVFGGCTKSGVEGHAVHVRLDVRNTDTGFSVSHNETVCAPIQSTAAPNARARFSVKLDDPGEYIVNAHIEAVNVSGQDSSESYRLDVEEDAKDALTTGGTAGRTEDTSSTGQLGGGSGGNEPDRNVNALSWVLNNQETAAAILLVLALLYLLGPFAEAGASLAGGSS